MKLLPITITGKTLDTSQLASLSVKGDKAIEALSIVVPVAYEEISLAVESWHIRFKLPGGTVHTDLLINGVPDDVEEPTEYTFTYPMQGLIVSQTGNVALQIINVPSDGSSLFQTLPGPSLSVSGTLEGPPSADYNEAPWGVYLAQYQAIRDEAKQYRDETAGFVGSAQESASQAEGFRDQAAGHKEAAGIFAGQSLSHAQASALAQEHAEEAERGAALSAGAAEESQEKAEQAEEGAKQAEQGVSDMLSGLDFQKVLSISDEIVQVSEDSEAVKEVAEDLSLGANSNIKKVAAVDADVTKVAAIDSEIVSLESIKSEIVSLEAEKTKVSAVESKLPEIGGVYAQLEAIEALYGKSAEIDALYAQLEAIEAKANQSEVDDHEERIQELEGRKFGLYGFKKHKLTGACTPMYDSVALGPVPVIRGSRPAEFVNPYKAIRIFNWRSCLMDTKQRILAYYGQAGYDTPTHDSQSYEVEIPAAYIKQWEDEFYTYRVMSEVAQLPGMFIPGAFRDNLGREMPFAYVDKYRRGVLNGYSVSRPDVLPEVSITLNAAELKAEAVDTDTLWTGCPEELDWYITFVGEIMACNTNSQAAYGQGMSSMPYSASHTVVTATTDANTVIVSNATANAFKPSINVRLGSALGSGQSFTDRLIQSITDNGDGTSTIVVDGAPFTTVAGYIIHAHRQVTASYEAEQIGEDCGFILHNGRSETQVENWINGIAGHGGNVYEFSFGLLRYDNYVYLCHDRYQFKHNDDPRNNSAFKNIGFFEDETGATYDWIKNMVMVGEKPYVMEWIQELGAGSTTHYADTAYYLTPTYRGTRIVRRRFAWANGSNCGRRSLYGTYVLSTSSWVIGWRASPSKLPKQIS